MYGSAEHFTTRIRCALHGMCAGHAVLQPEGGGALLQIRRGGLRRGLV